MKCTYFDQDDTQGIRLPDKPIAREMSQDWHTHVSYAEIVRAIKARRLTQQGAAELLGVDQSKVSRITRGQCRGVSEAKLLELVTKLGHDVKIVIGPVRRRAGKIELQIA